MERFEVSQKMAQKGYKYLLADKSGQLEDLYAKTISDIGPLMREYPTTYFEVSKIEFDWGCSELMRLWKKDKTVVVNALNSGHPGLTATFIAQGIADGHLTQSDVNTIANLLIEERIQGMVTKR